MRVMLISALMTGVAVAVLRASQQGPPRLSPEAEELQKRFPYPVIRDQRGVVPPGPRPLPSPSLGDGPWVGSTVEQSGEIWEHENGPNGGDELNVLKPGRNYGWPIVSYGRDYNGPRFPPSAPGLEEPVVFWVPSIAASGLMFYTGDRFPGWKRNAFVGGMREGEMRRR
jgi:hypothetical protein